MSQAEVEDKVDVDYTKVRRRYLIWALTLFSAIVLSISVVSLCVLSEKALFYPLRLVSALNLIKVAHPNAFDGNTLMESARKALFDKLDRYSGYLESKEMNRVREEFTGSYCGIGITVMGHDRGLAIMSVREDGPAGRVGIRTSDIIIQADSVMLDGISSYKASYLLRGQEGTSVSILVVRNQFADTLEFNLQRERLRLIHIPFAGLTRNKSLYIRIIDFEAGLSEDLFGVFDSLYSNSDDTVKAVILDLRGNPGGLLSEAISVSDMFLESERLIVGVKGRSRWLSREYYSSNGDMLGGLPLAILVDRGSASAAEVLAGALKYAGRAVLVGDTTFGKGLVQEYDQFADGSGIRLTTARYYFKGRVFLNNPDAAIVDSASGIPPDHYFKSTGSEHFPVHLESSLLMREFAIGNQDEILAYAPFMESSPEWFARFIDYAREKDFQYESELTEFAEFIRDEVALRNYSDAAFKSVDRICELAVADDRSQFRVYKDYIKQRLYQIAIEVKYGVARAYRDAILPFRQEISYAESILYKEAAN